SRRRSLLETLRPGGGDAQSALTTPRARQEPPAPLPLGPSGRSPHINSSRIPTMKKFTLSLLACGLLSFGSSTLCAQTTKEERKAKKAQSSSQMAAADTAPKSVIHIITVKWKAGATKEQIQAALDGAQQLPSQFPGIKHVWTK